MGRIVVTEFISVDGIMEDPGGSEGTPHGGWAFNFDRGAEGNAFKLEELKTAEVQLLGRVTYEGFAAAWPSITDPDGFAERMNGMPKYVVSSTLRDPSWNNTNVLSGDPVAEVIALKQRVDGNILVAGSAQLVQLLAAHDLVDEYRLMVYPVLLGTGKRLFADAAVDTPARLRITSAARSADVQLLVLEVDRAQPA